MILLVYLAGLIGFTLSQGTNLDQLPSCARDCLANATSHQGVCSSLDVKCLCSNVGYINVLACCLSTNCSPDDQQKTTDFNSKLCAGVNVTIPNFLGCPVSITSTASSKSKSDSSSSSAQTGSFTASVFTVQTIGAAVSFPSTAPVAKFSGGPLLGSSCTKPQFASVTVSDGILKYPWLGCSYENPGCCPFDARGGGSLSICPTDYTTTSSACCPSGWSIYSSAFAGQTPCYTNPPQPLVPPPAVTSANSTTSISVINNKIFTLKYTLQPKKRGLHSLQIAGAAVGASAGLFAMGALIYMLHRRRRAKQAHDRELVGNTEAKFMGDQRNSLSPQNFAPPPHISELESPGFVSQMPLSEEIQQSPTAPIPIVPLARADSPAEMPGSTYLDEHHPAYSGANGRDVSHQVHETQGEYGPANPSEAVSPLEGQEWR